MARSCSAGVAKPTKVSPTGSNDHRGDGEDDEADQAEREQEGRDVEAQQATLLLLAVDHIEGIEEGRYPEFALHSATRRPMMKAMLSVSLPWVTIGEICSRSARVRRPGGCWRAGTGGLGWCSRRQTVRRATRWWRSPERPPAGQRTPRRRRSTGCDLPRSPEHPPENVLPAAGGDLPGGVRLPSSIGLVDAGEIVRLHAGAGLLFELRAPILAMFGHGAPLWSSRISVRPILAV